MTVPIPPGEMTLDQAVALAADYLGISQARAREIVLDGMATGSLRFHMQDPETGDTRPGNPAEIRGPLQ